jgi:hypothetical protein
VPEDVGLKVNLGIAYINAGEPAKAKAILEAVLPKITDAALRAQVEGYIKSIKDAGNLTYSYPGEAGLEGPQKSHPFFDEGPSVRAEVLEDAALEREIAQTRVVGFEPDRSIEADLGQRPEDRLPGDEPAAGDAAVVLAGVDEGEPRAKDAQALGVVADLGDGMIGVEGGLDVGVAGEADEAASWDGGEVGRNQLIARDSVTRPEPAALARA